jgi:sec-independent protein translocase protein TatA
MLGLDNPIHLAFLLVVLLLVFGAKRLPEMGRSLGAGMRGFKESITGQEESGRHLTDASTAATGRLVAERTGDAPGEPIDARPAA